MQTLNMSRREKLGSRASRRIRDEGRVPGVVYGHGQETTPVSIARHDVELALQHGEQLVNAELDGQPQNFLIKDLQFDHLGQELIHVDLTRVSLDERVEVTVPIELRGTPVGVQEEGGVLSQALGQLTLECLVTEIPDAIRAFVTNLRVGQMLRVSDLPVPEGAKVVQAPDTIVATITVVAEEVVAPPVAEVATAEPEVIGAKEEAEEGEEEEK